MNQIIVTKKNGTTFNLFNKNIPCTVTQAKQDVELRGRDVVSLSVKSAQPLAFDIGDKITVIGREYTLNLPPKERKLGARLFNYDLEFEGMQYELMRASYSVNVDTTSNEIQNISGDSLTGDLRTFLLVLIANANRVHGAGKWSLGDYPANTETRTETFGENDNCLSVLQSLLSEDKYNTEFNIEINQDGSRVLNVGPAGELFPYTFEYGKGKGLYDLTRERLGTSNIITRLNVFGSSKNIVTSKYKLEDGTFRGLKLCLAGKHKGNSYLQDATAVTKYGLWEYTKTFEDIYPHRTGVVSALGATYLKFVDSGMDFDLNAKELDGVTTKYLIAGTSAKIHFNTGNLAGYEFELSSYDHATKTFTLIEQQDENGYKFPSPTTAAFQVAVGDEYVITDINLPQSYIDTAEAALLTAGTDYLNKYKNPQVRYSLTVEKLFLKALVGGGSSANIFWPGDYLHIHDTDLGTDATIRIKGFSRDIIDEYIYTLNISDNTTSSEITSRVISELKDIDKVIKLNNLNDPAKARRNWMAAQEVLNMVFDPEGDYYSDKIKPLSIDTTMLSVGAKSMQFGLSGVIFQPNYEANKNRIVFSSGTLAHYAILDGSNNPRVWNISSGDVTLNSDVAFYVYAKCEKVGTAGTIIFSTDKITVESDASYYHFLIGIMNSVDANNVRAFALMYGFTTVNGRFIKTGKIISADGDTYFDLDASEIGGKIYFKDGLVSGLIGVGPDADNINAGMNGIGTASTDIRFWAGATAANKATAPFRVQKDGKVYATDANISGNIDAETGTIGDWEISGGGIFNDSDTAYIIARLEGIGGYAESRIGSNSVSVTTGMTIPSWIMNTIENYLGNNVALMLDAEHGVNNIALLGRGNIVLRDGDCISSKQNYMNLYNGSVNVIEILRGLRVHVRNVSNSTQTLYLPSHSEILTSLMRGTTGTLTCTAQQAVTSLTATQYYINKGNRLTVGCAIKYGASAYQTVTEISRTNEDYDLITVEATLGVSVAQGGTFTLFHEYSIELTIIGESRESGQDLVNVYPASGVTWYNNDGASLTSVALGRGDIIKVIAYTRKAVLAYQLVHYKTS